MPHTAIPDGLLVVFEGIDGAGKSTQIRRLALLLQALGLECVCSREPTAGVHGQALRDSALRARRTRAEEHALLLADRREHLDRLLRPALARDAVVLLDRYYFSSIAYQSGAELDPARIEADNRVFAPEPDLLLILDLDPERGIERIRSRGDQPNAFEALDNLRRCRAIYRGFAERRYARLIDAGAEPDQVAAQLAVQVLAAAAGRLSAAIADHAAARRALLGLLGNTARKPEPPQICEQVTPASPE